jgi:outer membrane murein-binding lipoprotein Lpp
MSKTAEQWTDARLNDLAAAISPIPGQLAMLGASVSHLERLADDVEQLPAQVAVLTATVERLTDENRALRADLAAVQRELLNIAWGLVAAMLGAATALVSGLI